MSEASKNPVVILHSNERINLEEIPSLIANALYPASSCRKETGDLSTWTPAKINALHKHTQLVCEAIVSGKLKALKSDRTPITSVLALHSLQGLHATVLIDDIKKYLGDLDIAVQFQSDKNITKIEPSSETVNIEKVVKRKNALSSIIEQAKESALNSDDANSVWAALCNLARRSNRPPPLLGYDDDEGVKYEYGNEGVKYLSRKNFGDRFRRAKAR
jgi:hypothetical protein